MKSITREKVRGKAAAALLALGVLSGSEAVAGHGTEGGMYMGVDFGSARLDARAADYDSLAMQGGGGGSNVNVLESRFDRSDSGWSLVLWGIQEGHFGMELGYQKLGTMSWEGVLAAEGDGQAQLPVEIGISSRGWSGSAMAVWAFNDRVQLEGRAGAYFGKSKTFASFPVEGVGAVGISSKDSSISPMLGANVVFFAARHAALNLGYTWFNDVAGKNLGRLSLGARLYLGRGSP